MEVPRFVRRSGIVLYLQIAAAIVSLLLGIAQMTKESAPLVEQVRTYKENNECLRQQREAQEKATKIASMNINWLYRGNDGSWRYYSDVTNTYWCRTNIQGVLEYSESPRRIAVSNGVNYH